MVVVSLEGDVLDLLATREDFDVIGFLDRSPDSADPVVPNVGSDQSWDDLKNRIAGLKAEQFPLLTRLARLPETIRGFGHVKEANIKQAEAEKARLEAELENSRFAAAAE